MFKKRFSRIIIIVLSVSTSLSLYSQTWCPAGATWYYTDASADWYGYSKLTYINDTVINSTTCKKISHYYDGTGIFGSVSGYRNPYFTYEQNGVVYLYNNRYGNNKFDTLFNTNAQIGNRWRFPLVDTACADSTYFVEVLNTGTKNIQGFNLNWLYVKIGPLDYSGNQTFGYVLDTMVERLGYRYDDIDFAPCYGSTAEGVHGGLRCYSDTTFGSYSTGITSACDYITSIDESQLDKREVKIYPNPANDKLNVVVDLKPSETGIIEIADIVGKLQNSHILNRNNNITEISIGNLNKGVYIYKVICNNRIVKSGALNVVR
ncbi:MAG: T9SS type A sorting domain-containing protein [Bacteroidia bacterium]|jgi:hypothetical protein